MKYYFGHEEDLVTFVDKMGTDDSVCDAARVSMDKIADMFTVSQNERLIAYLAKHNHWSPFSHVHLKMRFKAPIFIARQLMKHQVGFAWNEVSRRYVKTEPSFWFPSDLRLSADNIKQGSSNDIHELSELWKSDIENLYNASSLLYESMVKNNVCAEQARMILPQSMMTEWIWTGSLYAWARMYNLRSESHAQREVQLYAGLVNTICRKHFPISWSHLCERTSGSFA